MQPLSHAHTDSAHALTIRSFASIPHKPLDWLWPHRIPLAKITLLAGDPGSGKTALSLGLAARLSRALRIADKHCSSFFLFA